MKRSIYILILTSMMALPTVAQKYTVKGYHHERITIDSRLDSNPDAKAAKFMMPYKAKVDSIMSPIVGHAACDMRSDRPETEMGNLLPDILVWSAEHDYNEKVDFGLYNIGGIRSVFSKGPVTIGDVVDVAPFENKICFITLKGSDVIELFQQIVSRGGEGVSHAIRCTATKDRVFKGLTINGKEVDPEGEYRIATIDYLLEGNDGMPALRKATNIVAPTDKKNDTRFIIMDYFREKEKAGELVDSKIEGRFTIVDN